MHSPVGFGDGERTSPVSFRGDGDGENLAPRGRGWGDETRRGIPRCHLYLGDGQTEEKRGRSVAFALGRGVGPPVGEAGMQACVPCCAVGGSKVIGGNADSRGLEPAMIKKRHRSILKKKLLPALRKL